MSKCLAWSDVTALAKTLPSDINDSEEILVWNDSSGPSFHGLVTRQIHQSPDWRSGNNAFMQAMMS